MLATHLLVGSLAGFVAGVGSWTAGLPLWAIAFIYILAGSLGTLASAVIMVLRCRRATAASRERPPPQPSRTRGPPLTFTEEAVRVVIVERHQND